jgi:hypothetical protein
MSNVDLSALLYLNPELAGLSNYATLATAAAAWAADSASLLAALPRVLPPTPAGFDPRLYLASQPDVSGANETIRLAMLALGLPARAIERRGVYVATFSEDVLLASAADVGAGQLAFDRAAGSCNFSPSNVRAGDSVRLLRSPGPGAASGFLHGLVASVDGTRIAVVPEPSAAAVEARSLLLAEDGGGSNYALIGIRVYDAERQALSALARNGGVVPSGDDAVPRAGFSLDTYRSVNPGARSLSPADAYLDFRGRWRRTQVGSYRVINADEVVNTSAPFSSLVGTLRVGGRIGIGMACLDDSGRQADEEGGVLGAESESGTRLAVDGDIFATGTLLTLSDARAKTDIKPIRDALDRVGRLTGCTYTLVESAGAHRFRRHTGLLAQDVAAAMPEAVYRAPDAALPGLEGPGSIAYGNLAGLFVEAIKELTARVAALEAI